MMLTNEEKKELLEALKKELFKEYINELLRTHKVCVETCREGIMLPEYEKLGDSGMDVRAAEDCIIKPSQKIIIPTGLIMAIPQGLELQARPRSGMSRKLSLRIANSPGTIDSGYRDEVGIILHNDSEKKYNVEIVTNNGNISGKLVESDDYPVYTVDAEGNMPGIYHIKKGDRIAQLVLAPVFKVEWEQVESGAVKTMGINRGGGFGHTGIN